MSEEEKFSFHGVSPELWKTLDELWTPELAGPLRRLPLLLNHKGKFKPCYDAESPPHWPGYHNDNLELLEIRYGQIQGVCRGEAALWFVVKHTWDESGQISDLALLRIWVQLFKKGNGREMPEHLINPDIPVPVLKVAQHGSDRYALVAMPMTSDEWNANLRRYQQVRINPDEERLVVHLMNSRRPSTTHVFAKWQAHANW